MSCKPKRKKEGKPYGKTLYPVLRRDDRSHLEVSWNGGAGATIQSQRSRRTRRRRGISLWCTGSPRAPSTLHETRCRMVSCVTQTRVPKCRKALMSELQCADLHNAKRCERLFDMLASTSRGCCRRRSRCREVPRPNCKMLCVKMP